MGRAWRQVTKQCHQILFVVFQLFISYGNFCKMDSLQKWKIVFPPISSQEGYISGRLWQKLCGSIKNLHVEVTYNVQGDRGQKTCWAYFVLYFQRFLRNVKFVNGFQKYDQFNFQGSYIFRKYWWLIGDFSTTFTYEIFNIDVMKY